MNNERLILGDIQGRQAITTALIKCHQHERPEVLRAAGWPPFSEAREGEGRERKVTIEHKLRVAKVVEFVIEKTIDTWNLLSVLDVDNIGEELVDMQHFRGGLGKTHTAVEGTIRTFCTKVMAAVYEQSKKELMELATEVANGDVFTIDDEPCYIPSKGNPCLNRFIDAVAGTAAITASQEVGNNIMASWLDSVLVSSYYPSLEFYAQMIKGEGSKRDIFKTDWNDRKNVAPQMLGSLFPVAQEAVENSIGRMREHHELIQKTLQGLKADQNDRAKKVAQDAIQRAASGGNNIH